MDGMTVKNRLSMLLILCALAVRFTIPAGWMPSAEHSFAVTVCTGVNMSTVWIDTKGKIHKTDPAKHKVADHEPCAFAGVFGAADVATPIAALPVLPNANQILALTTIPASIGKGLAAPPPPSTGPPSFI
jgi:hypothetical protein